MTSTDDIRARIQSQIEGLDSYNIVTDRSAAEAAGWLNLLRDAGSALSPFYASKQATSMFMGMFTTPDKKLAGIHFLATPAAAAAVLKAFPGYKLVDDNGKEIALAKHNTVKKPPGPKS